jgi:hypothetical protein
LVENRGHAKKWPALRRNPAVIDCTGATYYDWQEQPMELGVVCEGGFQLLAGPWDTRFTGLKFSPLAILHENQVEADAVQLCEEERPAIGGDRKTWNAYDELRL